MKHFVVKRKIIFSSCCVFISVLLLFQFYTKWKISKADSALLSTPYKYYADRTPSELVYKCCTQLNNSIRTNVFFLKTHKTGGTTVQSVILRFAFKNLLDTMNVKLHSYNMPFSDASIHSDTKTPNGKYNIMAFHMRYTSKLKSYQYSDTSMVTILRNPVKMFQSLYTYRKMDEYLGMSLQQFLNTVEQPRYNWNFTRTSMLLSRGYNQMSMDLGFDVLKNENKTAINEFVGKIDREFDLVMITEHMEESLILLANLMGWPLEYVTFITLNARATGSDSYSLTLQDEIVIAELNQVDTLLYNHFLRKFRKCVQQYGERRMYEQVQRFRNINEKFRNRCITGEVVRANNRKVELVEYKPKNESDLECLYSIKNPPFLPKTAHKIQAEKMQTDNF